MFHMIPLMPVVLYHICVNVVEKKLDDYDDECNVCKFKCMQTSGSTVLCHSCYFYVTHVLAALIVASFLSA
jgi:hypothetical protein